MELSRTSNINLPIKRGIRHPLYSILNPQSSLRHRRLRHPQSSILYPQSPLRRGFSFAEVMFAVVILGIGFIMVAAIFPVAIQQTQATGEENIAALAARDAADVITSLPGNVKNPWYNSAYVSASPPNYATAYQSIQNYPVFPPTVKNYVMPATPPAGVVPPPAVVVPFNGSRWKLIQSNTIVVSDQRYAFVPFYRRENGSAAAELIVISVAVRNKPVYNMVNDALNSSPLVPVPTTVRGAYTNALTNANSSNKVQICPDLITMGGNYAEGACVTVPRTAPGLGKPLNRTYTFGRGLGAASPSPTAPMGPQRYTQFELNPGDGMALAAGTNGTWNVTTPTVDGPYTLNAPTASAPAATLWGTSGAIFDQPLAADLCEYNSSTTLQPAVAYATLQSTPNNPAGTITLYADATSPNSPANAAPGTFVIIADDYPFDGGTALGGSPGYGLPDNNPTPTAVPGGLPPPYVMGALNGRIFRLASVSTAGNFFNLGTIYNLDPSYAMRPISTGKSESADTLPATALTQTTPGATALRARVYLVGTGQLSGAYTGGAQDIGVFASYFPVR